MVEFEADDALATAAARFRDAPGVEQVVICSPDKDLAQAVVGDARRLLGPPPGHRPRRGRRDREVRRPAGLHPRLAGAGRATPRTAFPASPAGEPSRPPRCSPGSGTSRPSRTTRPQLGLPAARAARLVESLRAGRDDAVLFLRLATLRLDVPLEEERRRPRVARRHARLRRALRRARRRGSGAARRGGRRAPLTARRPSRLSRPAATAGGSPPLRAGDHPGTDVHAITTGGRSCPRRMTHWSHGRPPPSPPDPDAVWSALVEPAAIKQYMFGTTVEQRVERGQLHRLEG